MRFRRKARRWKFGSIATALLGCILGVVVGLKTPSRHSQRLHSSSMLTETRGMGIMPRHRLVPRQALVLAAARMAAPQSNGASAIDRVLSQADTAVEQGRLDEGLKRCREALKLDPGSAHAYFLIGVIELERGADEEAKKALVRSVEIDPSRIASHVALGKAYASTKAWRSAAKQFEAAIRLGDSTGEGSFGLGLALSGESRYSEALPYLLRAERADPKQQEWLFTLVAAELQLKRVEDARKYLGMLERLSPADPRVLLRLSKLLEKHAMPAEAEASFRRATALVEMADTRPQSGLRSSQLHLEIARIRYDHHDFAGALRDLDKVEPSSVQVKAETQHLEGTALLKLGRLNDARERLRRAVEKNPAEPDYFFDWGWAELLAGDVKSATAAAAAAQNRWPHAPDMRTLQAIVQRESEPERARVPFLADWHLKGDGIVCCPCKVPCPCRSNGRPSYGQCESTGAYRIKEGHYGAIRLDGFTFAAAHACMGPNLAPPMVYVQLSAPEEQLIAMERIFQALDPLRPFVFLKLNRVKLAVVDSQAYHTYEANVPGVLELKVERQLDSQGEPLLRTAAVDRFSNVIEYARNVTYKVWDEDGSLRLDYSGRQANLRAIDLDSRDYRDLKMLIQYVDGSGYFNGKQLELIRDLKLPTLPSYPKPTN